jgi:hypothetical protein
VTDASRYDVSGQDRDLKFHSPFLATGAKDPPRVRGTFPVEPNEGQQGCKVEALATKK